MLCYACGHEMVPTTEPMTEKYREETFEVDGIGRDVCPSCGEYMIPAEESARLSEAVHARYAERHALLSPGEIASIRKGLGLTQAEFQRMLGAPDATVGRWESGRMQQSKTADNLMRAAADFPDVAAELMRRAGIA